MARLNDAIWEEIRAKYEVEQKTFGELAEIYKVNKSSISRRAKNEAWNQNATQALIRQVVDNKKESAKIEEQTQQLNATMRNAVMTESFKRLQFEEQSNQRLSALSAHATNLALSSEKVRDCKDAMEVLIAERKAVLGEAPNTAIQINNHPANENQALIRRVIVKPERGDD